MVPCFLQPSVGSVVSVKTVIGRGFMYHLNASTWKACGPDPGGCHLRIGRGTLLSAARGPNLFDEKSFYRTGEGWARATTMQGTGSVCGRFGSGLLALGFYVLPVWITETTHHSTRALSKHGVGGTLDFLL